ncbi:gamma response 1 protein [Nymphaea thermarum]|nr:gamma response 1 protein [Nymphaea thermarum]
MGESSKNCSPLDVFDSDEFPKYFSGLSTLLVATIQELKDRISQIEFIFCSQLFPNFQSELSKYRSLKERLCQAKKDAEADWKQKENSLLLLIEDLRREKQEALDQVPQIQASFEQEKADLVENFKAEKEKLLQIHEAEKNHLLSQAKGLQMNLHAAGFRELQQKAEEVDVGKEVQKKLRQQIKEKEELKCRELNLNIIQSKLLSEQQTAGLILRKFKRLKKMYFNLRYQYEILISRSGFVAESELPCQEMEDEFGLLSNPTNSPYSNDGDSSTSASPCDQNEVKDIQFVTKELENVKNSDKLGNPVALCLSNKTSFHQPQKRPVRVRAEIPAGLKRSNISWRNTRSRQGLGGADPHDDFLDTPMENIRENLKKVSVCNLDLKIPKEEVQGISVALPEHMDADSEEETQETDPGPACPRQKTTAARADGGNFKYVEPVRRKGDREFLKGFECKQCKKFYDALQQDGGIDSSNKIQCEHHDGVSRHRYRYLPPSTPDGFWNIGFDSDA